jgi:phosphate transport system substrate-binding protein
LVATAPTAWTGGAGKKYAGKVGEGKPQNDGVANAVKSTEGGVTYAEWSFAKKYSLGVAQIDNGAGAVELTGATAGAAVAAAKPAGEGNDLRLKVDYATKAADTYPIILVTYEIVCSKGLPADKTALVKSFLSFFASPEEQAKLEGIQYAPLPSDVQAKVKTAIDAIS